MNDHIGIASRKLYPWLRKPYRRLSLGRLNGCKSSPAACATSLNARRVSKSTAKLRETTLLHKIISGRCQNKVEHRKSPLLERRYLQQRVSGAYTVVLEQSLARENSSCLHSSQHLLNSPNVDKSLPRIDYHVRQSQRLTSSFGNICPDLADCASATCSNEDCGMSDELYSEVQHENCPSRVDTSTSYRYISPFTPTKVYQSKGLYGGDSMFAVPGFVPRGCGPSGGLGGWRPSEDVPAPSLYITRPASSDLSATRTFADPTVPSPDIDLLAEQILIPGPQSEAQVLSHSNTSLSPPSTFADISVPYQHKFWPVDLNAEFVNRLQHLQDGDRLYRELARAYYRYVILGEPMHQALWVELEWCNAAFDWLNENVYSQPFTGHVAMLEMLGTKYQMETVESTAWSMPGIRASMPDSPVPETECLVTLTPSPVADIPTSVNCTPIITPNIEVPMAEAPVTMPTVSAAISTVSPWTKSYSIPIISSSACGSEIGLQKPSSVELSNTSQSVAKEPTQTHHAPLLTYSATGSRIGLQKPSLAA